MTVPAFLDPAGLRWQEARDGIDGPLSWRALAPGAELRHSGGARASRTLAEPVVLHGCFGWLHTGQDSAPGDVAVLICPAFAWDALHSHHSMRVLADELAVAGYPTLRFNYPGTADSADMPVGAEPWAEWRRSVDKAADWLRSATGARRLILLGLRLGGTLATLVAERRNDVAGLALLAPVLRGRSYVRQISIEAQIEGGAAGPQSAGTLTRSAGLDFHEMQLSAETLGLISETDLRQARLNAGQKVVIFQQAASRLVDGCAQAWRLRGADTTIAGFGGLEAMLLQTVHGDAPPLDAAPVLDWVRANFPLAAAGRLVAASPDYPRLQLPGCFETPLQFGAGGGLFGMLCQPADRASGLAVIIGNTGRDPHYGIGRFAVELARRLAAAGIASLRMDFAGLGDSVGRAGEETVLSSLFEEDRTRDVRAAVDLLQQRGYHHFAIHGLCSGAYHGFHAAVADPRIGTLLLVNFPVFAWRTGGTVDDLARQLSPPGQYLQKFASGDFLRRLRRGELEIGRIAGAQLGRLWQRARNFVARLGISSLQSAPHRAMASLERRGARVQFLFAPGDTGIDAIEQGFGKGGAGLAAFEGVSMEVVPGLDHVLSVSHMRRAVADRIVGVLTEAASGSAQPATPAAALPPADRLGRAA